jgi:radical SAM protein with 4Fe4S-binding SPASM domain
MYELIRSLGVRAWQLQPVFPSGRGAEAAELHLSPGQFLQLGRFVKEWGPRERDTGLELRPADSCGYFTELAFGPEWVGCSAGIAACGIMSDGRVKGCLSMPDVLIEGDLRQHDLWDIWFRQGSFNCTRAFDESRLGANCAGCRYGAQCRGGCTSMSFTTTGRFHNDPYCFHGIGEREGSDFGTKALSYNLVQIA